MADKQNVGFIGLGNIGKPMAQHLIQDPYRLFAYDLYAPAMEQLVSLGATAVQGLVDLAENCNYIGICVRDNSDVESLLYGAEALLDNCAAGTHIAIHSTTTQQGLLKWSEDASKKGIILIDAPITGGSAGAEAASLCYMVGGDKAAVEFCTPIFETSGSKIIHAGKLGTGIVLKLCNNLITYTEFAAMSDAVKLAEAGGLSADVLREVGESNGVINTMMHQFISGRNAMSAAAERPEQMQELFGPMAKLGLKDLNCALQTAESLGVELPTASYIKTIVEDVFYNKI